MNRCSPSPSSDLFPQEKEIVDALLMSGTACDMKILGLINAMRARIDKLESQQKEEKHESELSTAHGRAD